MLYLCSTHFDQSKTKADNNMSGRIAQNYKKIKSKNYKKTGGYWSRLLFANFF
jgi:hypothetical protein